MTTTFFIPRTIAQVHSVNDITNAPSIEWNHSEEAISMTSYAVTAKPLSTISGIWMEKFLSNTSELWCTNFNIPDTEQDVVGVELQLNVRRAARIQDLVIQLTYDGNLIGDNLASLINPVQTDMYTGEFTTPLEPVKDYNIYGNSDNTWGATITSAMLSDPSFGVVISFQSNQVIPHSDLVYVDQLALRFTYA